MRCVWSMRFWTVHGQVPKYFSLDVLVGNWAAGIAPILDGEPQGMITFRFQVELEVPQVCTLIMRTSQCTLKEVYGFNPEGKALMKKTKNSEEFASAMSR